MREIIDAIRSNNGNEKFTTKEMLWYLISKTDCIVEKLDKKMDKKTFWEVTGALIAIFGIIVALRW